MNCKHCGAKELPTIADLRIMQKDKKISNIKLSKLTNLDAGLLSRIMRGKNKTNVEYYFKIKKQIEGYNV
jgi:predicted transcriptional regulator